MRIPEIHTTTDRSTRPTSTSGPASLVPCYAKRAPGSPVSASPTAGMRVPSEHRVTARTGNHAPHSRKHHAECDIMLRNVALREAPRDLAWYGHQRSGHVQTCASGDRARRSGRPAISMCSKPGQSWRRSTTASHHTRMSNMKERGKGSSPGAARSDPATSSTPA